MTPEKLNELADELRTHIAEIHGGPCKCWLCDLLRKAEAAIRSVAAPEPGYAEKAAAEIVARFHTGGEWLGNQGIESIHNPGVKGQIAAIIRTHATLAADANEDEAYEIGKRDGYEDAVQDIDIATGGDGEFRGSTLPGRTVDVPVMKQRIIDRTHAMAASEKNAGKIMRDFGACIEAALNCQPSTAEDPNEDAYQRGRFDGIMEYAGAILALRPDAGAAVVENVARPLSEWQEGMGDALWWKFPVVEPPYCGNPLDCGQTVETHTSAGLAARFQVGGWPGYHTHFTPITTPAAPEEER